MKQLNKWSIVAFFFVIITTSAHAASTEWKIDPAHSGIYFNVNHIYSQTRGYFEKFKGTVIFSPDDPAGGSFEFTVKVKSINTGNTKRDGHLNSAEFFDSKKYPEMKFTSTEVTHIKGNQYEVKGKMTVKDVTKSVKIPFVFLGVKDHPMDNKNQVSGLAAHMTIDRLDYHVGGGKFFNMGVVGKNVDVLISIEVTRKK